MKLKRMNGYLKDIYLPYKELVEETEFSKQGLEDFYQKTGKYLFVTLIDGEYAQVFDMEGTFAARDEAFYTPTGRYSVGETREAAEGECVELLADAYDVKMFILFFEKGLDMRYLLDRKPVYPAFDVMTAEFRLITDPDGADEYRYCFRSEYPDAKAFVNACRELRGERPID